MLCDPSQQLGVFPNNCLPCLDHCQIGSSCQISERKVSGQGGQTWALFGHCMSALQLGLQLLANLIAPCCSLEGGFAKCYEVQDLETKEIFAALFSKL